MRAHTVDPPKRFTPFIVISYRGFPGIFAYFERTCLVRFQVSSAFRSLLTRPLTEMDVSDIRTVGLGYLVRLPLGLLLESVRAITKTFISNLVV